MLPNRVVARFVDGRVLKGTTHDFVPTKETFHVIASEGGSRPTAVAVSDLKALFFVKDLIGNPAYNEVKFFGTAVAGRKLQVIFSDEEMLVGTTKDYQPGCSGFFLVPADPRSNNDRVYVVMKAVKRVGLLS